MTKSIWYNGTIIDLYDRSVAASLNSGYINTKLAIATLKRAIRRKGGEKGWKRALKNICKNSNR